MGVINPGQLRKLSTGTDLEFPRILVVIEGVLVIIKTLCSSASGLNAQQFRIDTTANNIANVNTAGFKKTKPLFSELIHQSPLYLGDPVPEETTTGAGVRVAKAAKYFSAGDMINTDRPLDLAIRGEGFFQLSRFGETYYSRDGVFFMDVEGNMVSGQGYILEGVQFYPGTTRVTVEADGTVLGEDQLGEYEAGYIDLYRFEKLAMLKMEGENMYSYHGDPLEVYVGVPGDEGFGAIAQGFLETPNFRLIDELTTLMEAQRAYGLNVRTTRSADEMWGIANNLRK